MFASITFQTNLLALNAAVQARDIKDLDGEGGGRRERGASLADEAGTTMLVN